MPAIKASNVRRMIETKGAKWTEEHIGDALKSKQLSPSDFSIRELAEELIGHEFVRSCSPRKGGEFLSMTEAADAVSASHFANISGQLVFNAILDASVADDYVFSSLVPTIPTMFDGEKIPGISGLGDAALVVRENEQFPRAGVNETWIETPQTTKRGTIVPITKEAIFFDRTGLLLSRCAQVGEALGLNKEKRAIDCVIDETSTDHRWKYRGTSIATYGDNSGTHDWDNLAASNTLLDWQSIAAMETLMAAVLDPETGEPMNTYADTLIVTPQNAPHAYRILNAMHTEMAVPGYAVSANPTVTRSPSPLGKTPYSGNYQIVSSRLLAVRMALGTAEPLTSYYLGAPKKAFAYMQNWPITVVQAPANSSDEFNRDIVAQYKASERGAYTTLNPRYMCKSTVA